MYLQTSRKDFDLDGYCERRTRCKFIQANTRRYVQFEKTNTKKVTAQ